MPVDAFEYTFPAIRGIQAGREYYASMCPLKLIPKIFLFDEEELVPEVRAQRILNKSRVPEMAAYILQNHENATIVLDKHAASDLKLHDYYIHAEKMKSKYNC